MVPQGRFEICRNRKTYPPDFRSVVHTYDGGSKTILEEEETRERVSSMDVLRILKQRGDKDKWARDVVRGGAQNLAHSLCARVIKTFNAKLKHEGKKHCLDVGRVAQILV